MLGATSRDTSVYEHTNFELFFWDGAGTPERILEIGQTESNVAGFAGWDDEAIENWPGSPSGFMWLGDRLYFGADDYVTGYELWVLERL